MSKKLHVTFLDFDERNKQVKQLKRETRAVQSQIVFFDRSEARQKYWWIPAHAFPRSLQLFVFSHLELVACLPEF